MQISVHDAGVDDAVAIADIHVRSWRVAYRGLIDAAVLDRLSVANRARTWRRRLDPDPTDPDAPLFVLTARVDGTIGGFCSGLALPAGSDQRADALITSIYVDPTVVRHRVGTALMDEALARLRAVSLTEVVLWVLRDNAPARAFYGRYGFVPDGAADTADGAPEIRLRASLASS